VRLDRTKLKLTIKKGEAALLRGVLFGSNRSITACIRIRIETQLHFSTFNAELERSISKWRIEKHEKFEISRQYANRSSYHPIKRLSAIYCVHIRALIVEIPTTPTNVMCLYFCTMFLHFFLYTWVRAS